MTEPIIIESIQLQPLHAEQVTRPMARRKVSWHALNVVVRNVSDSPLFVISDARRIKYDPETRTLRVQFSDRHAPAITRRLPLPPQVKKVGAGEHVTLTWRVSSPLTFLIQADECERKETRVSLEEEVGTIDFEVAYGTEPPARRVELTSEQAPTDAWRKWGRTVSAVWRQGGDEARS